MVREASNNGRKIDRWWVQTVIYIATLLIAGGVTWATVRGEVKANCRKNVEQDEEITTNRDDIHRLDTEQARAEERWRAIQNSLREINAKLDKQ